MNLKKLFLMLTFFVLLGTTAFAQTYVSNTNGSDVTGDGLDVGLGIPYATIAKAITMTADGGTIIIDADTYNEAGPIDLTGGGAGKNLTFVARTFNSLSTVTITNGIALTTVKNVNLGVTGVAFQTGVVNLTAGTLNISTANLTITTGGTITRTAGTINATPTTTNVNVTYNGTVDVASGAELPASLGTGALTVSITAGKTLTVGSAVSFTDAGLINVTTGNVTFGNTVAFSYATATVANAISYSGANTVTFNSAVTLTRSAAAHTITFQNTSTGTLSFAGGITNNTSANITLKATNSNIGKLQLGVATINGDVANTGNGTIELLGAVTISSTGATALQNTGTGVIKLNGNQLTLSGAAPTYTNAGNMISSTASTVGTGMLNITGVVTLTANGELPNVNIGGTIGSLIVPNATVPVYGTFTLGSPAAGALTFNGAGGGIDIYGAYFNRTDNTPGNVVAGNGTLSFRGGLTQAFTPGASLTVYNLTVNKTASIAVSLGASVSVSNNLTITSGTLDVGNYNLNMTATGIFDNSGQAYSSTNIGYVAFLGAGGTVQGTGTFGNILINTTPAASTVNTGSSIAFSGILFINQGTFNVVVGHTLTMNGSIVANPTVKINTTTANASAFTSAGTVTYAVNVNLNYFGANNFAAAAEWSGSPTKINDVTIGTDGGTTVTGVNASSTINGNLVVNGNVTLAQGANVYTLAGDSKTHSIVGTVSGGTLTVTGSGSALNGTTSTTAGFNASVNNLAFEPAANGATFSSTNLKTIGGTLTLVGVSTKTGTSATITMNPTTSTLTGALAIGAGAATTASVTVKGSTTSTFTSGVTLTAGALTLTRGGNSTVIGGAVTITAGTLTLGSNVSVTGATSQVAGNIDAGGFTYTQLGSGATPDYNRTGAGTFTNGTLSLNSSVAAIDLTPGATFTVPNLSSVGTLNGSTINAAMEVTNSLTLDNAATFTQTGILTVSGNTITVTSDAGAFTGALTLTGVAATATFAQSYAFPTLVINSSGTVTFASSSSTARTITVATAFTNTAGTLATGINNLVVNGTFTYTAGSITQSTGILTWGGTQTLAATGFSIDNLTITAAANVGTSAFTVNKALVLSNALTTSADGKLTLGDGCLVTRTGDAFKLTNVPTFGANTDVEYSTYTGAANILTDKELPASVRNFTVLTDGAALKTVLTANVTVTGTLSLADMLDATTTASTKITMADGSTLELKVLGTLALDEDLTKAGAMNLVYNGAATTTSRELGAAVSTDYPAFAGNVTVKANVANDGVNTTTWNGSFTFDGGDFDMDGFATTVGGSISTTTNGGTFVNTAGAAFLNLTGATNTTLALGANWPVGATINLRLNKTNNTNTVALSGGNLDFSTNNTKLYFQNGILTTGTAVVILRQDDDGLGNPIQGFDRSGVTGTNISHVSGNVRKYLDATSATYGRTGAVALTRVEFPVGSSVYKPMAFQFNTLPTANFNLTVNEIEATPGGSNGFPITSGSIQLANYPNFYWLVTSDLTLQPAVVYDIEAEAYGYGPTNYPEGIQNVRFLRRFDTDINNPWVLQGGLGYDNSTNVDHAKIIVRSAQGAISTQGARFTYSQAAKAPIVTTASAAVTVAENAALTIAWTKTSQNIGGTVTFGATPVWTATTPAVVPTNATFDAASGTLTWTPTYAQAGVYTVKVTATDAGLSTDNTVTITVTDAPRPPVFAAASGTTNPATATIGNGIASTITYLATDADGDAVTYSYTVTPTPSASSVAFSATAGTLTFTPAFEDVANSPFTFVVTASSGTPAMTATVTTVFTVTNAGLLGDVNLSGTITSADALLVLNYVVNPTAYPLTAQQQWAADVKVDGVIGAYDAASILVKAGGGEFLPKQVAAAGTVEFGRFTAEKGVFTLPINIENTAGVKSFYSEIQLGNSVEFSGVSSRLPEGWIMTSNFENGTLKIAMAGLTPLTTGSVAFVNLSLVDKESSVSIQGSTMLNDQVLGALNAVKIKEIPSEFSLSQNYPNPFNPTTSIKYAISENARVNLVVYNVLGQIVRTLVNAEQESGYYTVKWDGTNDFGSRVSSGIYIYRISAGNFNSTAKMNLLK